MSIIDMKYRGRYRQSSDWLGTLIEQQATNPVMKTKTTRVEGEPDLVETVETGRRQLDLGKLFSLAEANGIAATEKFGDQTERKNAAGRLRMTIGNMLRAAAKHRHGLYIIGENGELEWVDADAEFIGDRERTQERDGTKIAKAKPAPVEATSENSDDENSDDDEEFEDA